MEFRRHLSRWALPTLLIVPVVFFIGCGRQATTPCGNQTNTSLSSEDTYTLLLMVEQGLLPPSALKLVTTPMPNGPSPTIDVYGPDINMNQYGQPVTLWPDFGGVQGKNGTQPLFDAQGQTAYFLEKNGRMINPYGESVAWVDKNGNVYNYEGQHQGWFKGGHIRGHDGGVMLYQPGAYDLGVIPPIPEIQPIPPIPQIEPIRPIPSIPPIEPIPSFGWSEDGLE